MINQAIFKNFRGWQILSVLLLGVVLLTIYTWFTALSPMLGSIYALAGVQALVVAQNKTSSAPIFTAKASTNFQRAYAYRWAPASLTTYRKLAQVFTAQNNLDGAISTLEQAYQSWPNDHLLQQELALAYLSANKMEEAHKIWDKFGTTPERMVIVGDEYLKQYHYEDALAWYNLAIRDLAPSPPDLIFRRAALAIMVHSSSAQSIAADLEKANHEFLIYQVKAKAIIPGAQLRLLTTYPEIPIMLYGVTLADGYAQTKQVPPKLSGILWRSGEVIAVIQATSGDYLLKLQANHRGPAGVKMAIGVDGKILKVVDLDNDVATWEKIKINIALFQGLHTVNIRFLNELSVIGGEDRKLEIAQIEIEKLLN